MEETINNVLLAGGFGARTISVPNDAEIFACNLIGKDQVAVSYRSKGSQTKEDRTILFAPASCTIIDAGKLIGTFSIVEEVPIPVNMIIQGTMPRNGKATQVTIVHAFEKIVAPKLMHDDAPNSNNCPLQTAEPERLN